MEISGRVRELQGQKILIALDERAENKGVSYGDKVSLLITDSRKVTTKQRNFAYALMNDIAQADKGGQWAGMPEQVYSYFKLLFAYYYDDANFSLSTKAGNRDDANKFIDMLLKFCITQNIAISKEPLKHLESDFIYKFEYLCLLEKKCVICGKKSDLHHLTGSKVGIGNNRNKVNHLGRLVMALCRAHHDQWHHNEGELMSEYHLNGVKVDERLAKLYHLHQEKESDKYRPDQLQPKKYKV